MTKKILFTTLAILLVFTFTTQTFATGDDNGAEALGQFFAEICSLYNKLNPLRLAFYDEIGTTIVSDQTYLRNTLWQLKKTENTLIKANYWLSRLAGKKYIIIGGQSYLYSKVSALAREKTKECILLRRKLNKMYLGHKEVRKKIVANIKELNSYKAKNIPVARDPKFNEIHAQINYMIVNAMEAIGLIDEFPGQNSFQSFLSLPASLKKVISNDSGVNTKDSNNILLSAYAKIYFK